VPLIRNQRTLESPEGDFKASHTSILSSSTLEAWVYSNRSNSVWFPSEIHLAKMLRTESVFNIWPVTHWSLYSDDLTSLSAA